MAWRYASTYEPIKMGSIDGTGVKPHDRALVRAINSNYCPDPSIDTNPRLTVFVARMNAKTTEDSLRALCEQYGRVVKLRIVRDIVTGASKCYGFVEYENDRSFRAAFSGLHRAHLDGSVLLADYERERVMAGWKPRRLGGGLGGNKQSGQLRFGGRDRPFRLSFGTAPPIMEENRDSVGSVGAVRGSRSVDAGSDQFSSSQRNREHTAVPDVAKKRAFHSSSPEYAARSRYGCSGTGTSHRRDSGSNEDGRQTLGPLECTAGDFASDRSIDIGRDGFLRRYTSSTDGVYKYDSDTYRRPGAQEGRREDRSSPNRHDRVRPAQLPAGEPGHYSGGSSHRMGSATNRTSDATSVWPDPSQSPARSRVYRSRSRQPHRDDNDR